MNTPFCVYTEYRALWFSDENDYNKGSSTIKKKILLWFFLPNCLLSLSLTVNLHRCEQSILRTAVSEWRIHFFSVQHFVPLIPSFHALLLFLFICHRFHDHQYKCSDTQNLESRTTANTFGSPKVMSHTYICMSHPYRVYVCV